MNLDLNFHVLVYMEVHTVYVKGFFYLKRHECFCITWKERRSTPRMVFLSKGRKLSHPCGHISGRDRETNLSTSSPQLTLVNNSFIKSGEYHTHPHTVGSGGVGLQRVGNNPVFESEELILHFMVSVYE